MLAGFFDAFLNCRLAIRDCGHEVMAGVKFKDGLQEDAHKIAV